MPSFRNPADFSTFSTPFSLTPASFFYFHLLTMNLRSAFLVLSSTLALSLSAQAGGFGGPGPFRNGSPLPSGTDGVYSAVANGTNLTGLFYFTLSGGLQTEGSRGNSWTFFVDGQTLRGTTTANVANGKVAGILDSGLSSSVTGEDGTVTLPIIMYIQGNSANGVFQGTMDMNSPTGYFDGKGELSGTPDRVDQIVSISENGVGAVVTSVTSVTIPGSTLDDIDFRFRGSRLSISASTATSSNSTTSN